MANGRAVTGCEGGARHFNPLPLCAANYHRAFVKWPYVTQQSVLRREAQPARLLGASACGRFSLPLRATRPSLNPRCPSVSLQRSRSGFLGGFLPEAKPQGAACVPPRRISAFEAASLAVICFPGTFVYSSFCLFFFLKQGGTQADGPALRRTGPGTRRRAAGWKRSCAG